MYKRILLPTDGSPISRKAVKQGIAFAKAIGAGVVGFYSPHDYRAVLQTQYVSPFLTTEDFEELAKESADKHLGFIEKTAAAAGVPFDRAYTVSAAPWEAIIEAAKKKRCDLILMGSHGRSGLAGVVLGSQTTKVLTHSKIPVLVTR